MSCTDLPDLALQYMRERIEAGPGRASTGFSPQGDLPLIPVV
jgi:hypothetical protein